MSDARFVLVDSVVVDVVLRVDDLPQRGSDTYVDESTSFAGGGFNVMAAAARLGLSVVYGGVVGFGPFATIAQEAMRREEIVVAIPPIEGVDTGFVVAIVEPDGERTFLTSNGAEATLTSSELDTLEITERDIVYFSGYVLLHESNARAVLALLERIPRVTCFIFDPGPLVRHIDETHLRAVFDRVDWFSCNAREAQILTSSDDPTEAARLLRGRMSHGGAIVRVGAEGCVVAISDTDAELVAGFNVTAVDSNGAGDAHVGAFAALLVQGRSPTESARWANAAAAMSVTRRGPATGPTMSELETFMAARTGA